jgi:hypothetical protein
MTVRDPFPFSGNSLPEIQAFIRKNYALHDMPQTHAQLGFARIGVIAH